MRSNDTLVDTSFQLISDFFHVNQGVLSMLNKLPPGVCWRGGGGGRGATGLLNKGGGSSRLPGLVTKQQAVEFPQVQTSIHDCPCASQVCWHGNRSHDITFICG